MPKPHIDQRHFDWHQYTTYAQTILEGVQLYQRLLKSPPLTRLSDVSFIGALELFSSQQRVSDTRFDHTVGVAYLMIRAARELGIPKGEEQILVTAALLHDVGHGALSHSIEAYFKRRFAVDHKSFTRRIIRGDLFIGKEVADLLRSHRIDPDHVIEIIEGSAKHPLGYLLKGPINVDTIDGISRASRFFDSRDPFERPDAILSVLVRPSPQTQCFGDHFWLLKKRIYNSFIYRLDWSIYDSMITRALSLSKDVLPDDFLLTDSAFKRKFRVEIDSVRRLYDKRHSELIYEMQSHNELPRRAKKRDFEINYALPLGGHSDLPKRYIETKAKNVPHM